MITQLKIEGRLTQDSKGAASWLSIDSQKLVDFMPDAPNSVAAQVEAAVVKKNGEFVRTNAFWQPGDRVEVGSLVEANQLHEKNPENEPFYIYHLVVRDWGKVTITVEFEHG